MRIQIPVKNNRDFQRNFQQKRSLEWLKMAENLVIFLNGKDGCLVGT